MQIIGYKSKDVTEVIRFHPEREMNLFTVFVIRYLISTMTPKENSGAH